HTVRISFRDSESGSAASFEGAVAESVFGRAQYQWKGLKKAADPDGPIAHSTINADPNTEFELPAASIIVLRGKIGK
ncbi:MAG TPA: glycosyl hydrolase family 5, partial [Terriglobales bacterium]